ncbi:hypothetical protein GOBAR_AA33126 [Gossypium barbadense]|nr:hypothetical protein GOBAR_AA33126 [Gossypium barbadense]
MEVKQFSIPDEAIKVVKKRGGGAAAGAHGGGEHGSAGNGGGDNGRGSGGQIPGTITVTIYTMGLRVAP